jgi:hypothetical protein
MMRNEDTYAKMVPPLPPPFPPGTKRRRDGGRDGGERGKRIKNKTHTEASRVPVCASNPGAGGAG